MGFDAAGGGVPKDLKINNLEVYVRAIIASLITTTLLFSGGVMVFKGDQYLYTNGSIKANETMYVDNLNVSNHTRTRNLTIQDGTIFDGSGKYYDLETLNQTGIKQEENDTIEQLILHYSRRKLQVLVAAEQHAPLTNLSYEWGTGNGMEKLNVGDIMLFSGWIKGITVSCANCTNVQTGYGIHSRVEVQVNETSIGCYCDIYTQHNAGGWFGARWNCDHFFGNLSMISVYTVDNEGDCEYCRSDVFGWFE